MKALPASLPLPVPANLWAGALSQLLSYEETGCPHSARRAADLLNRLAECPGVDRELRDLCERAGARLEPCRGEMRHVPRA